MHVLFDTTYLYRLTEALGTLPEADRRFLSEHDARVYVSAVSVWEMRLKYNARHPSGERKSPFDPNDVLAVLEGQDVTFLPMSMAHAKKALDPPLDHKDPFDELLLVQAQEEGLRLLTADRRLAQHPLAVTVRGGG